MNDLSAEIGLMKRQLRDEQAVTSNIDHCTRSLVETATIHRPDGLVARLAVVELLARSEKPPRDAVAKQHFARDTDLMHLIELTSAVAPAQTGVATWAAELAAVVV